jgi:hypothetical protein
MAQPNDLDVTIAQMCSAMSDALCVLNIITELRRNADRLPPMLPDELRQLKSLSDQLADFCTDLHQLMGYWLQEYEKGGGPLRPHEEKGRHLP